MARFDTLADWLEWQEQCHSRQIDLGLDRVADVYRQLNSRAGIVTITVAGTNGKGSCVAFLEAIYRAQGYKVGAYTSPHILHYNERIRIDGQPVADDMICAAFERIDQVRGQTSLSYFEFGTLAALDIFQREQVDVQLLEVGLGGRLDAVNIIDPDVSLVTTIALDHVDWLGDSLEKIAREKAGIFRTAVPAIIGDHQAPTALNDVAQSRQALVRQLGQQFDYCKHGDGWDWHDEESRLHDLPPPAFKGEHQYRNASAVIMAVQSLQSRLPVAEATIRQGLIEAKLCGRFQLMAGQPLVLLDVGHNPQAVQTLLDYLHSDFPGRKIRAVFAMMKDKDIAGVIALMRDRVAEWYLAPLQNPRAASQQHLCELFHQHDIGSVHDGYNDFSAAFAAARQTSLPEDMILIFGSFFLVSEYLSQFAQR